MAVNGLSIRDFQLANEDRCVSPMGFKHPLNGWSTLEWAGAMCGEAGEAANYAKKLIRIRDNVPGNKADDVAEMLRTKCIMECCDTIIYAMLMMSHLQADAELVLRATFNNKSQEIGYKVLI
jgi:hypothetical protein